MRPSTPSVSPADLAGSRAVRLDLYEAADFDRGRPRWIEAAWLLARSIFLTSPLWGSPLRVGVLRLFGARIGRGVTIKPGVRVKFPWRLRIGNHCWIGEDVWLDNLAEITIGDHCCLSQGAYLCTGSHDWSSARFDLLVRPIVLENEVWLAARSIVGPGITAGRGAVLALGSVATGDLRAWHIHQGVPGVPVKVRKIRGLA